MSAVSTGVQMYGQYQAGKQQAAMAKWQAEAQNKAAQWNAEQQRKQAAYEESTAQKNLRRERENNKRELARRRASAARGGLAETGAVSDELIEASERHQKELDDIWDRASTIAQKYRSEAAMDIWEGKQGLVAGSYKAKAARQAASTAMWSTGISGATKAYTTGKDFGLWGQGQPPKEIPVG